jgi:hypothetical protein
MMASWRAVLPRHTAHQWRLTVSCEDGLCQLFTPRSQGGLQQAVQIAPSEGSGRKLRSAPEHARSTVPARPARTLVLEGDHPGGTERARRSPAPASQHAATHNHAPPVRVTGPQRTPNRRSVRQPPRPRSGPAGTDQSDGSGASPGGLARHKPGKRCRSRHQKTFGTSRFM